MIGQQVSHYTIVDKLGAGAMGEVYLARDLDLKRSVALKVLPAQLARDPERLARFRREAESLAALDHPNIVTIFSIEHVDDLHILTMECVRGRRLDDVVVPGGLPLVQLLDIALALSDALSAAHGQGITHRDLKPANLMLTMDGRLKVLDFGLAKFVRPASDRTTADLSLLTREQTIVGTLPYMAPEQIAGADVDGRADLFSFGIVLFELATGRRPFGGETLPEVMTAILGHRPLALADLRRDLPAELGRILARCLEKRPEDRYAAASDLHRDLLALRAGSATGRPRRPAATGRRVAALTVLAALAGLALWRTLAGPTPPHDRGIVLMPFTNGGSPEDAWVVAAVEHGVAESLSAVNGLVVRRPPRNWLDRPVADLCAALDAGHALAATVYVRDQDGVRQMLVTPELSRAGDGALLPLNPVDRAIPGSSDAIAVQRAIADQVLARIGGDLAAATGSAPTRNDAAYNLYLKGRFFYGKRDLESLEKALGCYQQAVALDPEFALAHAGIASINNTRSWYCLVPPKVAFAASRASLEKALAVDPELPEAWAELAGYHQSQLDFTGADVAFQKAITFGRRYPRGYATGHQWYSMALAWQGRHEAAHAQISRAAGIDPTSPIIATWVGLIALYAGRTDEALARMDQALDLDSGFLPAFWHRSWVAGVAGKSALALADARRAQELQADNPVYTVNLAWAEALAGRREQVETLLTRIGELEQTRYVSQFQLAAVYVATGEHDEAFRRLERACEDQADWRGALRVDPRFAALRTDPRFAALCARLGL